MILHTEQAARDWLGQLPEYDQAAQVRLELLIELLVRENTTQNLVSAASLNEVWRRHIVDSAQLLCHVPRETNGAWLDLGTGAGFPGLVVAALRPELPVLMVESRTRRIDWLERACAAMGLTYARVIGQRLEQVPTQSVRAISARAFAPLARLVDLAARFSTTDTLWLLPKGRSAGQELEALRGWKHAFHVEQSLTDAEAGIVIGHLVGKTARKGKQL